MRDPINLVDARGGIKRGGVGIYAYARNLFNETYNDEFSPGGFVFRARPRVWGAELTDKF